MLLLIEAFFMLKGKRQVGAGAGGEPLTPMRAMLFKWLVIERDAELQMSPASHADAKFRVCAAR